jgi:hypothetical protein
LLRYLLNFYNLHPIHIGAFLVLVIVIVLGLIGCAPTTAPTSDTVPIATTRIIEATATAWPTMVPTSQRMPSYLLAVYPPNNSTVGPFRRSSSEDGKGNRICLDLTERPLLQPGDNLDVVTMVEWHERVKMLVDGRPVSVMEATQTLGLRFEEVRGTRTYLGDPITFCTPMPMEPGRHEVTFQVSQTSGNVLTYTWSFTIADEE